MLNHHGATILITTNWFHDSSKNLLSLSFFFFFSNPGFRSQVFPLVHGLPGILDKPGISASPSHEERVSAAVGFPLLELFILKVPLFNFVTGFGARAFSPTVKDGNL